MRAASNRRWARNDAPCGTAARQTAATTAIAATAGPSSVIRRLCPSPSPSSPDVGSTAVAGQRPVHISISVVRIGGDGWDETRRDTTRLDEWDCIEQWQGIFASPDLRVLTPSHSHPLSHPLSHPHPAWPDSPLPGAALVAAPLDEHAGSRINYRLPGSRRPSRPSALSPSRSCPRRPTSVPCPGRLYTMAHVSPQLHLAQHGAGSMATLPRPRRP
jgi:hypothetical protein